MNFEEQLRNAQNFGDVFELVKKIVFCHNGTEQAGIMLGLSDLGVSNNKFVGAFYSLNGNMIVVNKRPLDRIKKSNPNLYKPYIFHILLHEYIHSLGFMDEEEAKQLTYQICLENFGADHIITQLAQDMGKFVPHMVHPADAMQLPKYTDIDFVLGFDRKNTNYIM